MERQPPAKVALVTGAGRRRIGSTVVRMLAERGYSVAIHYNRSAGDAEQAVACLRELGTEVCALAADVADETQVERLFHHVLDRFGRLDVLVTAAAVWEPKPLEHVTAADVRRHFEINALGTYLCCQRAGLIMVGQPEGGVIVTLGDWAVARPYPGYSAYFPSKGAIPTMTRMFAVELATRNRAVRANCILPGPVMLPDWISDEERQQAIAGTLVRREGRPEHIGQTVLFLIENDFITGVCLPVDGGRTIAGGESDAQPFSA